MNVIRFIKDWTLAIAIAVGAAIYLTFAFTPELSDAADFLPPFSTQCSRCSCFSYSS